MNNTSADSLRQAFEAYRSVQDASFLEGRFSSQSKGFGFVEMPDTMEANNAIAHLNGSRLDGRNLTVEEFPMTDQGQDRKRDRESDQDQATAHTPEIGNSSPLPSLPACR